MGISDLETAIKSLKERIGMDGIEFFRLMNLTENYYEKYTKITKAENYNGADLYQIRGYELEELAELCYKVRNFLGEMKIGGKA